MAESTVIAHIGATNFQVHLDDGKHTWLADEPESSAAAIPVPRPRRCFFEPRRMHVDHAEDVREAQGLAAGSRARDAVARDRETGTMIDRQIVLKAICEDQRERLLQIANACPVHKILTQRSRFGRAIARRLNAARGRSSLLASDRSVIENQRKPSF